MFGFYLYPMDFKMQRNDKGTNPREYSYYVTGVSKRSQQSRNLKYDGYIRQ